MLWYFTFGKRHDAWNNNVCTYSFESLKNSLHFSKLFNTDLDSAVYKEMSQKETVQWQLIKDGDPLQITLLIAQRYI